VKFAAIDIGSNAVRLLLARVIEESDEPLFKKEVLVRMPLRLGDDVFRSGVISDPMAERLVATMVGFKHLITAYPALVAIDAHVRSLPAVIAASPENQPDAETPQ